MATKIKTIQTIGNKIVCKGKLLLIKCTPKEAIFFGFADGKLIDYREYKKDGLIRGLGDYLQPIIISETEETKGCETHIMRAFDNAIIVDNVNSDNRRGEKFYKILAMPENFSPETLQQIVDGKLKDGDEVFMECELQFSIEGIDALENREVGLAYLQAKLQNQYQIKLTDNFVTLVPAEINVAIIGAGGSGLEKEKTWQDFYDEVEPLLKKYYLNNLDSCALFKILDEAGYNPPTKKIIS